MTKIGKCKTGPTQTGFWQKMKKGRVWAFSGIYLTVFSLVIGPTDIWNFVSKNPELNEIGDFLAGLFAPLALIWLIVAVITQREELEETRSQAVQAQKVIRKQLRFIKEQNREAKVQSIRAYKLDLFNFRYEIFNNVNEIAAFYDAQLKVKEYRVDMDSYAHRSLFIFGSDVSEYLARVAANYQAVENIDSEAERMQSNPGDIYVYNGPDHRKEEYEDLMSKRRGFMNEIQVALSYKNRTELFGRYLAVTDAEKEIKATLNITLEDVAPG